MEKESNSSLQMDPIRTGPRQMWELDPEAEKVLANRSIWVRGLGLGRTKEEVMVREGFENYKECF